MNVVFAASLFDSPWVVATVIIVGTLINWLAKRREEKKAAQPAGDGSPPAEDPPGEFNLEETLRRFLGEEPLPRPPPLPPANANLEAARPQPPEEAIRRFEQLSEQARHPARVVTHPREPRARRSASPWRNPKHARQAFVASVIFDPPKCMEP